MAVYETKGSWMAVALSAAWRCSKNLPTRMTVDRGVSLRCTGKTARGTAGHSRFRLRARLLLRFVRRATVSLVAPLRYSYHARKRARY